MTDPVIVASETLTALARTSVRLNQALEELEMDPHALPSEGLHRRLCALIAAVSADLDAAAEAVRAARVAAAIRAARALPSAADLVMAACLEAEEELGLEG